MESTGALHHDDRWSTRAAGDGADRARAHAYLNTTSFGGTTPAEACATCHGVGKDWDVAKVHAR